MYRLVVLLAIAIALSGVFSCDSGCLLTMATWQSQVHTVFGLLVFVLFFVIPLVAWRHFRRRSETRTLGRISFTLGIAVFVAFWVIGPFFGPDGAGYGQRLAIPLFGVWAIAVSLRLAARRASAPA